MADTLPADVTPHAGDDSAIRTAPTPHPRFGKKSHDRVDHTSVDGAAAVSVALSFDQWNRDTTRRICANEDPDTAAAIRADRTGPFACVTLWDDYLAACAAAGRAPELQF